MLTPDLQKINSIVTTIKLQDKELEKQNTKLKELEAQELKFIEDQEKIDADIKKGDEEIAKLALDEELEKLKAEFADLEKQAEPKSEERALLKEIEELKSKIADAERHAKSALDDITAIKEGKYNWNLGSVELADNAESNSALKEKLAKSVNIERKDGRLTPETIQRLINACLDYYQNKFIILTLKERAERRKHMDDLDKWVAVSMKLFDEIDKVTDESQKEFLTHVGIDFQKFNDEVEQYCKEENRHILILMSQIPERMKMMMKSQKALSKNTVKEVLKYQIEMIMTEMPKLFYHLPRPDPTDTNFNFEKISLLITNRSNDLIWKKFEAEEEDFIEAIKKPSIANDLEVRQIKMQLDMIMMQLAGGPMGGPGGDDDFGGGPMGPMGMGGPMGPGGFGGPGMF